MKNKISFFLRLIVSVILLQSLYFKFGGHAQAVHVFSTLGVEPWGRYLLGSLELIVTIGLLFSKTQILASLATLGLMTGAIASHLFTPLGIEVQWDGNNDGGQLFFMAVISFVLILLHIITYFRNRSSDS
jgi:putative oxidoreductase